MSETTARFALPFILPGQAQKEFYHNEALARVDAALHPAIEEAPRSLPPPDPEPGQCWIVEAGASGVWSGNDHSLAAWTDAGWRYVSPQPGMLVWNKAGSVWVYWSGGAWSTGGLPATGLLVDGLQVVSERQPNVPSPSGGTVIDAEARAAINALRATLISHGLME